MILKNRLKIALCFSDLGNEWAPAVLKSEEQVDLIYSRMISNHKIGPYWIEGTSRERFEVTPYSTCESEDKRNDSGGIILLPPANKVPER